MRNLTMASLAITIVGTGASACILCAMIDSSIKSLLLLLAALLLCLLLRTSAAIRHLIWSVTLVGLIVLPLIAMLIPQWKILPSWMTVADSVVVSEAEYSPPVVESRSDTELPRSVDEFVSTFRPADDSAILPTEPSHIVTPAEPQVLEPLSREVDRPDQWRVNANLLLAVWGFGAIGLLIPLLISIIRLSRIERKCRKLDRSDSDDCRLAAEISGICSKLKIKVPAVLIGDPEAMPMVWSIFGSRLLLPDTFRAWNHSRTTAVLMHELTHLRRRDPTLFLLGMLARAIYWFNPLVWYASHRLRVECETACDDSVLESGIQPDEYATHLLDLSTSLSPTVPHNLAFAMTTRPQVETRIISILNQKLNRRGVTMKRAILMLILAVGLVTILASLSAAAKHKIGVPQEQADDLNQVQIRWPHCEVVVKDLKERSLADAIERFNSESKASPLGSTQPPVRQEEVLTAIENSLAEDGLKDGIKAVLKKIKSEKQLPPNVYFRRFTRFDDEFNFHGVWWVRLIVVTKEHGNHFVKVRSKTIYTRRYTQMERQQNRAKGTSLINRVSSYFLTIPKVSESEVPELIVAEALSKVKTRLEKKDLDGLKKLCVWYGTSKATQQFVEDEFKALINAKIESVTFEEDRMDGDLITWSAYQKYKPNLPVVGHISIKVAPEKERIFAGTTLYLEVGISEGKLRFVNYVPDGERNFPMKLSKGLSITGHNEMASDGKLLMTSLTSNPGKLISAHLANEEIWERDFAVKRNIHIYLAADNDSEHEKAIAGLLEQEIVNRKEGLTKEQKSPAVVADQDSLFSDNRIISKRLDQLFEKLKVKPKLRKSSHARDLPELYRQVPGETDVYMKRRGVLVLRFNPGIKYHDKMEHIWLHYLPQSRMYFVEHRVQLDNPYDDHVFGPYRGNPLKLLPEIEEEILRSIKQGITRPTVLGRMMKQNDHDLTQRVINVVDRALDFDLEITQKNMVYKSLRRLLDIEWDKRDPMRSLAKSVARLDKRFSAFDEEVESLTLEFADSDYSSKGIPLPKSIDPADWGPADKGLQFAAVLDKKDWALNETVSVTYVLRNVSKNDIKLSVRDLVQELRPEVKFDRKPISTSTIMYSGWRMSVRYLIKPGQEIALAKSTLNTFDADKIKRPKHGMGLTSIPITKSIRDSQKPVQLDYNLRIGMSESWSRGKDGKMRVYSPAKGEWKGELRSAPLKVKLK